MTYCLEVLQRHGGRIKYKKYQTPWRIPNVPTSKHTYIQVSHAIAFKILGATHLPCMTVPTHMCVSGKRMKGGVILHTDFFSNLFSNKSVMNKNVNYFSVFSHHDDLEHTLQTPQKKINLSFLKIWCVGAGGRASAVPPIMPGWKCMRRKYSIQGYSSLNLKDQI